MQSSDQEGSDKVKPRFSLPYIPNKNFVGREEELNRLHSLLAENQPVAIAAVAGMGGVGKTELAVKYAHQHRNAYDGGFVWLSGRGNVVDNLLEEFTSRFGQQEFPVVERKALARWCWEHWQPPEKTVLVVIDDVSQESRRSLFEALPRDNNRFRVLVTTRLQGLETKFEVLRLNVLPPDKALELLGNILEEGDSRLTREPKQAEELCEWLGYLPLGLELVGRYLLDDPDLSLAEVLAQLKAKGVAAESIDWEEEELQETESTAQRGVRAAFELSWEKLTPEAQGLGRLLAVFANEAIPGELLTAVTEELDWSAEALRQGRKELYKLSLVERCEELEKGYQLHPLIWQFLTNKLAQVEEAEAYQRAFIAVLIPRAKEIEPNITVGDVASLQFVIPHLQAIAEHYLSLVEDENNVILPFLGIGRYYYGQGFYSLAEHWYEKCLQATKNRLGKEHPNFAQCLNNLALVHSVQGKYGKAELGFRKAIELFTPYSKQHQNQENHLIQASFINNLGQLYQAQRKYTEAESLHSQALNIRKCQLGEEKFDVAQSLNNLAEVYRAQGKYKEAEPLYNQAIEISELDEENLDVATFINNLALLYHAQGWYKKAESKFFKALEILKRMLVQDHPRIASCLSNIAGLYYTQGQYEKAEPLYRQALEIFDRALGSDHPNTINCRENLEIMRSERGESEI